MSEQRNNDTPNVFKRQMPEVDLAARLEILNGLLNELTDVLDVREVFERVSNVVQRRFHRSVHQYHAQIGGCHHCSGSLTSSRRTSLSQRASH
jgi:hypothetical protein